MPFDTTYYFVNYNKSVKGTATIRGRNDTPVYVNPGQLPSDIDTLFATGNSIISHAYQIITAEV